MSEFAVLDTHMDPYDLPESDEKEGAPLTLNGIILAADNTACDNDDESSDRGLQKTVAEGAEEWRRRRNEILLKEIFSQTSYSSLGQVTNATPLRVPSHEGAYEYGVGRQRGLYDVAPVRMKSSVIDTVLARATQTAVQREASGTKKCLLPQNLPQELDVPLTLRCSFCRKFDSICSNCHRKWKGVLLRRRRIVAFQSYCKLPMDQRCALLLMTAAYGTGEFAAMQLDFDGEKCLHWRSSFFPLRSSAMELHNAFNATGEVYALHVAFAYNNVGVAEVLLGHPRCLLLKSEHRVDPLMFLQLPLRPEWENMLNASDVYANHLIVERAKQMRRTGDWSGAEALYAELFERKPDSEHAHCGWTKMRYDQGYVEECIRLCNSMISGETVVDWNEISVETIKALRDISVQRYHEYCHNIVGNGVVKACGCVILDRVCVPIRRLPFSIIVDHILLFCDAEMLWNIFNSTRIPLLRTVTEKLAVLLPSQCLQTLLEREPGFHELSERLLCNPPTNVGSLALLPARPLGVSAVAMADFNMFLIRVHFAGMPMKSTKPSGSSGLSFFGLGRKQLKGNFQDSTGAADVALSKQYRIYRSTVEKPWCVTETGEWEVDALSVEAIQAKLHQAKAS